MAFFFSQIGQCQKKRVNHIHSLKVQGRVVAEEHLIHSHVDAHFKNLFRNNREHHISLAPDIREDNSDLSTLEEDFKEVKEVVWGQGADKAPMPDSFPIFFFKFFWELVKGTSGISWKNLLAPMFVIPSLVMITTL